MKQLDLITQKICPKYPRPAKFSDPGGDFSDEELKELIRKRDNELTETDLMCIFQGALPAGEYHEVMYFLPIALQHIVENKESDTANELLRWISYNQEELQADGYYDDLLKFFETGMMGTNLPGISSTLSNATVPEALTAARRTAQYLSFAGVLKV
jgi:hypothetical protein